LALGAIAAKAPTSSVDSRQVKLAHPLRSFDDFVLNDVLNQCQTLQAKAESQIVDSLNSVVSVGNFVAVIRCFSFFELLVLNVALSIRSQLQLHLLQIIVIQFDFDGVRFLFLTSHFSRAIACHIASKQACGEPDYSKMSVRERIKAKRMAKMNKNSLA
jgi:hypothetical protein